MVLREKTLHSFKWDHCIGTELQQRNIATLSRKAQCLPSKNMIATVITFQCCKVLSHNIINSSSVLWCLISLQTRGLHEVLVTQDPSWAPPEWTCVYVCRRWKWKFFENVFISGLGRFSTGEDLYLNLTESNSTCICQRCALHCFKAGLYVVWLPAKFKTEGESV